MINNFKIKNATLSLIDKTTGEPVCAIEDITDVNLEEVDNEYIDVDFDATFPNGSRYKAIAKMKKSEFEALYK